MHAWTMSVSIVLRPNVEHSRVNRAPARPASSPSMAASSVHASSKPLLCSHCASSFGLSRSSKLRSISAWVIAPSEGAVVAVRHRLRSHSVRKRARMRTRARTSSKARSGGATRQVMA